jgi:hypothetical protein
MWINRISQLNDPAKHQGDQKPSPDQGLWRFEGQVAKFRYDMNAECRGLTAATGDPTRREPQGLIRQGRRTQTQRCEPVS